MEKIAFKEWAVIVKALEEGKQTIILRKGGISEGKGGFQLDHSEFWLFPTLYHQQSEMIKDSVQHGLAEYHEEVAELSAKNMTPISSYAQVVAWKKIENKDELGKLSELHVWTDDVIMERFDWGRKKDIHALLIRTYKLPEARQIPLLSSYGGCKSWIELEEDISISGSKPIMSDQEFLSQKNLFEEALGTVQYNSAMK